MTDFILQNVPTNSLSWSSLTNATGALTLANGTNATTFNHTSAVTWTWADTIPTVTGATNTLNISSSTGPTNISGNVWEYTYAASESGSGSNAWVGASVTIAGYTGGATGNNGTFVITASTTTTFRVTNATGTTTRTGAPFMISSAVVNSPILALNGTINSGTAGTLNSIADTWTIQNVIQSVAPNPVSKLTFAHTGTTGQASVDFPAGTAALPSITFGGVAGNGIANTGVVTSINTSASSGGGLILTVSGTTFGSLVCDNANGLAVTAVTSGSTGNKLSLGAKPPNTAIGTTILMGATSGANYAPTASGTEVGVQIGTSSGTALGNMLFNPTSGAANFTPLLINPGINQTSTASGNYFGEVINVVETALLGTANRLLSLQAGSTGGTVAFDISGNQKSGAAPTAGIITTYNQIATVSNGVPSELAKVDLVTQSAAITATTLYAVPSTGAGMYRVTWVATITTAGTTSVLGGTNGFQVSFVSPTDSVTKADSPTTPTISAANSTGTSISGCQVVYAKASTNIQYAFGYTSTGTTMVYELHIKCECLG